MPTPESTSTPTEARGRVEAQYVLAPLDLRVLNPFLTERDLADAVTNGAKLDNPDLGSGLCHAGAPGELSFWMSTDVGMNRKHVDKEGRPDGKAFPLPEFTPTLVRVHLEPGLIKVDEAVPVLDAQGKPVTGLPNGLDGTVPYLNPAATIPLVCKPSGLDPEDLALLPDGDFLLCEEYGPGLVRVGRDGRVRWRLVPPGRVPEGAGYEVRAELPRVFAQCRPSKGLEGLCLSGDGRTAYAVMQAALGVEDSRVARLLAWDLSDPDRPELTGHFLLRHQPISAHPGTDSQDQVAFSAVAWVSPGRLLLLERGEKTAFVLEAPLDGATNLRGRPFEDSLEPEGAADWGALGVEEVPLRELLGPEELRPILEGMGGLPGTAHLEGLDLVDGATLALSNDNDFGMKDPEDRCRLWIVSLSKPLR